MCKKRFLSTLLIVLFVFSVQAAYVKCPVTEDRDSYMSWFEDFQKYADQYAQWGYSSAMEQMQQLVDIKPPGGGEHYTEWLAFTDKLVAYYAKWGYDNYKSCFPYLKMAKPGKVPAGFYNEWMGTLDKYLSYYAQWGYDNYKTSIEFMKTLAPKTRDSDYDAWYEKFKYYQDYYNQWGYDNYKYCCDILREVKPEGGGDDDNDEVTLDFLDNLNATGNELLKGKGNTHEFITLISVFKEKLVSEVISGDKEWAREEYDRLKAVFGQY